MAPMDQERSPPIAPATARNRFDRMEWAGAFGDLGTLIPFVVAYITLLKVNPYGILLAFGVAMIVTGFIHRTPFPVQPMKAIGAVATTQAAQTFVMTPATVYAAGLVTGLVWIALGVTGATKAVTRILPRAVVIGIILGLGFSFMIEGVRTMSGNWWLSAAALAGTLLLLRNRVIPAMFLLLVFGAIAAIVAQPQLLDELVRVRIEPRLPTFTLANVTWQDVVVGALFLALPQVPLTLGNAIVAITEENNRLFPDRPVTEKSVSISTGILNLFGAAVGGIPMCHGAGGMAGHVSFGARTGGATIILGAILLAVALFLSGSVTTLLAFFPAPILGVILFLTGSQLALGSCDFSRDKGERFVTLATAAFAAWNIGIAFVFGIATYHAYKRGWFRL
jgi:MFS superfamily sulfate permease-like transporter